MPDWRYIFFVPLPLIMIALALGFVFMPSVRRKNAQVRLGRLSPDLYHVILRCKRFVERTKTGWFSDQISGFW